jgi:hypothetical protein
MHSLAAFQSALGEALQGETSAIASWLETPLTDTPGLSVYRNTVARGSIDVLAAAFSTVVNLVGEDWFRAAAAIYVAEHRPSTPSLLHYGDDFADWLASFPPAQDTPYLSAVAQLDRLWWDSYFAAEAERLDPAVLLQLDAPALQSTSIVLHPSVRLAAFDHNLASLWLARRDVGQPSEFEIAAEPETILIARKGLDVASALVSPADHAFLAACQDGASIMTAASRALAMDPAVAFPDILAAHHSAGVFSSLAQVRTGSDHDL